MRFRPGFISNSSSSSFIIQKKNLTKKQIERIRKHKKYGRKYKIPCWDQPWGVYEEKGTIECYTGMDNFSMEEFLERIGVPPEVIQWEA